MLTSLLRKDRVFFCCFLQVSRTLQSSSHLCHGYHPRPLTSPGGMDGPIFKAVEASNAGRFELLRGQAVSESWLSLDDLDVFWVHEQSFTGIEWDRMDVYHPNIEILLHPWYQWIVIPVQGEMLPYHALLTPGQRCRHCWDEEGLGFLARQWTRRLTGSKGVAFWTVFNMCLDQMMNKLCILKEIGVCFTMFHHWIWNLLFCASKHHFSLSLSFYVQKESNRILRTL